MDKICLAGIYALGSFGNLNPADTLVIFLQQLATNAIVDPFSCVDLFHNGVYHNTKLLYVDSNNKILIAKHFIEGAAANRRIFTLPHTSLTPTQIANILYYNPDFTFNTGPINMAGKSVLNQDFYTVFESRHSQLDHALRLYTPKPGWEAGGRFVTSASNGRAISIIR